ncbi:DEAD/DEAH box helicase [Marinitenerispora sediminis]|uniref:Probable helicase HelY n=1 Tax=Marinitenerispora sediminis TaxID=1931232 RepID=A0A368T7J0_9ACTN|nr:DEAD/DEAH box helicase [Marinitenerispora sediminis]RCV51156.1 RNA helicase [Marinitenerispora sediminis]RCV57061.1 RNA helicase [Marinitenerispora sediminis]RCV59950.1 RNA helicase [Marinitenerispora sediminis]
MSTHAARYAEFRRRQSESSADIADFQNLYGFEFDEFQIRACKALEMGHGVLVAAPTGSGKTVVGEYAVHRALRDGSKCFYTTPIKALSNQKYTDLVRRYGAGRVGLLTGDNSVNGEAPIVVMTTEVLRNMLYAGSQTLGGLAYVVMDEVHYLADRFRGAVWEEVIIHLPESVRMVALSATVSNAEEFGEWLLQVRGDTTVIVDETRPVPLWQHVMVGNRIQDLFVDLSDADPGEEASDSAGRGRRAKRRRREGAAAAEVLVNGERMQVNPRLVRLAEEEDRLAQLAYRRRAPQSRARSGGPRPRSKFQPPNRVQIVQELNRDGLLPAITFVFSRAGCDDAVRQCVMAGLSLTTEEEAEEIREYAERQCADIPPADLAVLGYHEWIIALQRGIAAHHAGLLPTFKEVVESLFSRGLIRAVFATETLALGINMPARTVVIEKLDKWNGETHAALTAGEYTQLTGRAGRRGIDVEGHAVVLWQPGTDPQAVAGLASTRTYPLNSSFQPSYNMAVNLVGQVGRQRSRSMLESSFAQFQADRAVVGLVRQLRKHEEALEGYAEAAECHLGDFMEYARMRRELSDREAQASRSRGARRRQEALRSLEQLRVGDIIRVPAGRHSGYAVVLDPGNRGADDPAPLVLTMNRQVKRVNAADFPVPAEPAGRLRIPKNFSARSAQSRRDLASALRSRLEGAEAPPPQRSRGGGGDDPEIARLRRGLRSHPCHGCADREEHARWAERYFRLAKETDTLRARVEGRSHVIARTFDRVCGVLQQLDYLDGDTVTPEGRRLAKIYSELDLLAAECLRRGLWEDLTPAELAACLSTLVYEARRSDETYPRVPAGAAQDALAEMVRLWGDLHEVERDHRVSFLREPDLGFVWATYRWANGDRLDRILDEAGMPAGDFVRATKMLIDMLGQIADAAPEGSAVRGNARTAMDAVRRGVVAYSSVG